MKTSQSHTTAVVQWADSGTFHRGREIESGVIFFAADFFVSMGQKEDL